MGRSARLRAAALVAAAVVSLGATTVLVVGGGSADPGADEASPSDAAAARSTPVPMTQTVETTSGSVRGLTDGRLRGWLGLPYAAPPTGPRRWQPPAAPAAWEGVRDADRFGAPCMQPRDYTFGEPDLTPRPGAAEDCLYLNVERPDDDVADLPVLVFLHGGGFFGGSGTSLAAEAHALVERGVVLVTPNYRLGRLGFFAHPALGGDVANFGLLDQVAALTWVQDNAAAFGGDPDNVTLVGASAGAMSVNALMASPRADGLFDKAISQSAPSDARALSLSAASARGEAAFPDRTAAELRALPAEDLLSSTFNTLSGDAPIVDAVLPRSAAQAFARGEEDAVPYLTGTTLAEFADDDYRSFGVDPDALRASLGGAAHDRLLAAYGDGFRDEVLDDLVFVLPTLERAVVHGRRAPTYRYVFGHSGGAGHGSETAYVLDTVTGGADGRLSDAVADYWVAFARTGRPEVEGLPTWPEASAGAYLALVPDGPTPSPDEPRLARLAALRTAVS